MDGDVGLGYSHHRQKRSRTQMEDGEAAAPSWPANLRIVQPHEPSAGPSPSPQPQFGGLHLPSMSNRPTPPRRFLGDGLDYRRPVSLSRSEGGQPVIDLTADDGGAGPSAFHSRPQRPSARLPRFPREIIDVEEEDDRRSAAAPASPEIEFISARHRSNPPPANHHQDATQPVDVDAEEDDIEILGSNRIERQAFPHLDRVLAGVFNGEYGPGRLQLALERATNRGRDLDARLVRVAARRAAAAHRDEARRAPLEPPRGRGHIHIGFVTPQMEYNMVGFDLGLGGDEPRPQTPPTYDAPPPAPAGFTRKPEEEDAYVCPNCGDELRTGATEQKKQVWMVRGCGHIYCGDCTINRYTSRRKSTKGKEKAIPAVHKPFKECVIEGCSKKTNTTRAMAQLFL